MRYKEIFVNIMPYQVNQKAYIYEGKLIYGQFIQNRLTMTTENSEYTVNINVQTKFIFSTSGSASSIVKHNNAFKELKINLVYFTIATAVSAEEYAALLRSPISRGAAVTGRGGLKSTIIPFLDEVEPLAAKTRAVNTVVNKSGKLYGYNSDAVGLKSALIKGIETSGLEIKTAVIYGNGGVSGVAFHVLQELGIKATMAGRDPKRVAEKRRQLGIEQYPDFGGPYDLVVDATPVSSEPDFLNSAGLSSLLDGCKMVFCHNMPEKDDKTNYLERYCQEKQLYFIPGKWMYNAQLAKQYRLLLEGYLKADGSPISEQDVMNTWKVEQ
ncbi:MAG: Shikimate dehydrogenase substrate binding domain protein [Bacteroidetes bacterium]|nr:Shikimate dehydrogenase substrate binding domain protein [Bacteroidota bacterium]